MTIHEAIPAIIADLTAISKDKRNPQQGFMYRGIDDVYNALHPLFAKHRVFVVPEVLSAEREERQTRNGGNMIYTILRVKYSFFAEDGSSVCAIVNGEAMDSADKSSNKAMAAAMKYAMFQVFCIPTEDMADPDADTPPESVPAAKKSTQASKQTADKKPAENAKIEYLCDACHKPIKGYDFDGKHISAEKHMALSKARYDGACYCRECAVKLANAIKMEKEMMSELKADQERKENADA